MGERIGARVRAALDGGDGVLRLGPDLVPRSFLMPAAIDLSRDDRYPLGDPSRGICEAVCLLTTASATEGAPPDEKERAQLLFQDAGQIPSQLCDRRVRTETIVSSLWQRQAMAVL